MTRPDRTAIREKFVRSQNKTHKINPHHFERKRTTFEKHHTNLDTNVLQIAGTNIRVRVRVPRQSFDM